MSLINDTKFNNLYIAAAVVVVLFIIYTLATWTTAPNEQYIGGFWMADDDEFCEDSDIGSMLLYIGDPVLSFGTVSRDCYIVVTDDVYAGGFTMKYRKKYAGVSIGKYNISSEIVFDDEPENNSEDVTTIWPHNVEMTFDILAGTLLVTHNDMIYAKLYKNHEIA